MELAVVFMALVVLAVLAPMFGADSRRLDGSRREGLI
jgi:hypothetical protein